jgi:uncharacterized UPF0146 family protein
MAERRHGGGFIDEASYWSIGTDEQRGRDGDTARDAAKKYNDHRHSAAILASPTELLQWSREITLPSAGGQIEESLAPLRASGDVAEVAGDVYMATSEGTPVCLTSGFGAQLTEPSEGMGVIVPDFVSTVTPVRFSGNAEDVTLIPDVDLLMGTAVLYPSVRAHRATMSTVLATASALKVKSALPPLTYEGNLVPTLSANIRVSYIPSVGGLVPPYTQGIDQSLGNLVPDSVVNTVGVAGFANTDIGHRLESITLSPSVLSGQLRLTVTFSAASCYSDATLLALADAKGVAEAEILSALGEWVGGGGLSVSLLECSVRTIATFGG